MFILCLENKHPVFRVYPPNSFLIYAKMPNYFHKYCSSRRLLRRKSREHGLQNATNNFPSNQGLSQDLDSRVSKMDFGGDRVSWWANAARSMRSLKERAPLTAGGLGPAQGPQKPEGLGALKCILWLFLALIFIILHIEKYVFSVWIIHFIDIFPGMSNLNNFSIAILHTRMTRKQAPTLISRSWNSLSRSILSLARRKENLHNYL